jgi:hypothetical protein
VPDEKINRRQDQTQKSGREQREEEEKEKAAKGLFFFFWRQEIACTDQMENRFFDLLPRILLIIRLSVIYYISVQLRVLLAFDSLIYLVTVLQFDKLHRIAPHVCPPQ